jgi:magnesium transporter
VWRNGTLEATDVPLEQVSDYLAQPDCLVWADLCSPDAHLLKELGEELALDDHAVEDAVAEHERPKATRYATHLFLTTYALSYDTDAALLRTAKVSAFSMARAFVTVRLGDSFDIDAVVRRWDDNEDLIKFGPRALIHGLLDEIVDGYFETVESLDDEIEDLEDLLFDDKPAAAGSLQRRTFALRRSLVQARRTVLPMREVVNTVMRRATDGERNADLTPYFEDLYDHVLRAAEWTESLRDMVTSVFETTMSLSDLRMNQIMKKLTSWAAIIAVPTAITGYFGQNVPYPGFGTAWGFWLSVGAMLLIAFALYLTFKLKDWL